MFLFAPIGNGLRLRAVPVATVLLAVMHLVFAAWTLPQSERLRKSGDVDSMPRHVARTGSFAVTGTRTATPELQALRHAADDARQAALVAADPMQNWGYRRDDATWRAVGALFVHANVLHLMVNVVFLLLAGAFLEQVWSPVRIFALYLAAGPLALILESFTGPPNVVLGASGAVAALLGACCVLFRDRPVRCAYVYFEYLRPRRGNFDLPCLALAAIWLVQQFAGVVIAQMTGDYSIAYVSHLGGFALGAVAALAARRLDAPRPA